MEGRDPGFQRVRPWGNAGDRKNDGWSPARRILFQSYAPSALSASELTSKLDQDYAGAIDYWEDYFDRWDFVHDDLQGMAPMVAKKVVELDENHGGVLHGLGSTTAPRGVCGPQRCRSGSLAERTRPG
jgi:hypothetical protein